MTASLLGIPGLTFGGAGIWAIFGLIIVHMIRIQPKMRELANNADGSLRKDLMELMAQERAECDRRLEVMSAKMTLMQQTIDGLHRQLIAQSSSLALRLAPSATASSGAADRVVERLQQELDAGEGKL